MDENFFNELKNNATEILKSGKALRRAREDAVFELKEAIRAAKEAVEPEVKLQSDEQTTASYTVLAIKSADVFITVYDGGFVEIMQGNKLQGIDKLEKSHLKNLVDVIATKAKEKWLVESATDTAAPAVRNFDAEERALTAARVQAGKPVRRPPFRVGA